MNETTTTDRRATCNSGLAQKAGVYLIHEVDWLLIKCKWLIKESGWLMAKIPGLRLQKKRIPNIIALGH
jgi:hypothetical protein